MKKLSFSTKLFYGIGQWAEGIKNAAFGLSLLFFYTQILGLSGSLAGLAIFIALCWDAVTDSIAGSISDNFRSRWGRRHPFMYASAIPLGVTFYLVYAPPSGLSRAGLFVWLLIFAMAVRTAMTLYHVPHMALGAELSEDYMERTSVVGYRIIFSTLGIMSSVIVSFALFFVETAEYPEGQMNPDAYPAFAVMGACFMVFTIWISAIGTQDRIPFLPKAPEKKEPFSFLKIFRDIREALRNRSFLALFVGAVAIAVSGGIQSSLMLHLGTYFWEISEKQIIFLFAGIAIGSFIGAPVTKFTNRWIDKKPTMLLAVLLSPIFVAIPIILRLLGMFPANDDPMMLWGLTFFSALSTFCGIQGMVSGGSIMADIIDEHELVTGRRQEGIFFGAQSFIGKTTHGLGATIAGIGLDIINLPAKAEPGTVDPSTVTSLGILYGIVPIVPAFIAFMFYSRVTISRESHAKTSAELEAMRSSADSEM